MPNLEYINENGLNQLKTDSTMHLLVVLFREDCKICSDQIDDLNNYEKISSFMKIVFVTTDIHFLKSGASNRWINLFEKEQILFGVVKRNNFLDRFGSLITPSYYLFNQKGTLIWMARGKVPFEQITMIMLRGMSE